MKIYSVKEAFYSIQGEGANVGRPAVFCRFAGCNLWTGREEDRASAVCAFCDTDFVGVDGIGGASFGPPRASVRTWRRYGHRATGGRSSLCSPGGSHAFKSIRI